MTATVNQINRTGNRSSVNTNTHSPTAVNINSDTVKNLDTITKVMMAVLIIIPFLISFGSLWGLADEQGVAWAWLYPLMVDGGLLIFKLLVLSASLRGETDRYSWFMAGLLTVISVALNVAHVPADSANWFLAAFMFGLPPALILAAFVAVTRRVESQAKRESAVMTLNDLKRQRNTAVAELRTITTEMTQAQAEAETTKADMEALKASGRELHAAFQAWQAETEAKREALAREVAALEEKREALRTAAPKPAPVARVKVETTTAVSNQAEPEDILAIVADAPDVSQAEIARQLDMSAGWVSKQVRQLKKAGMLSKNGHGWEVNYV